MHNIAYLGLRLRVWPQVSTEFCTMTRGVCCNRASFSRTFYCTSRTVSARVALSIAGPQQAPVPSPFPNPPRFFRRCRGGCGLRDRYSCAACFVARVSWEGMAGEVPGTAASGEESTRQRRSSRVASTSSSSCCPFSSTEVSKYVRLFCFVFVFLFTALLLLLLLL